MNDTSTDTQSIARRVGEFLHSHRMVLLISSVILLGGIIISVGVYQYLDKRAENAARAAELVETRWDDFLALSDAEKADSELPDEIRGDVEALSDRYSGSYGELRGRFILAGLEWELTNYAEAQAAYTSIAEDFPRSHLVGVSLAAAAAAAEMQNDSTTARALLTRVADGEGMPQSEQSRALFNLGRLAEAEENWQGAYDLYNRMVDEHGESSWTNLGRDRIIWLTSQGLAREE